VLDLNNTANASGLRWLQQTLDRHHGAGVVRVEGVTLSPDHMDVVIVPLCEGTTLINPLYVNPANLPDCLRGWTLIPAAEMVPQGYACGTCKASNWIGLNLLVIDGEDRSVLVEERQTPLLKLLEQHEFRPIPVRWRHGRSWGGSFHCISLNVHRDGVLGAMIEEPLRGVSPLNKAVDRAPLHSPLPVQTAPAFCAHNCGF